MRKWCIKNFQLYELAAMEDYLQEMAGKGWMLDEIRGGNFFAFRKAEPCQMTFSAVVVGNMSMLGAEDCEEALKYRSCCEESGWSFVCSNRVVQIFCAGEEEEPIPIETDEQLKFQSVWKQQRKSILGMGILVLFWSFYLFSVPIPYIRFLKSNADWLSRLVLLLLILLDVCEIVMALVWYGKGRRALKKSEKVHYWGRKAFRVHERIWKSCVLLAIAFFLGLVLNRAWEGDISESAYLIVYFVVYLGILFYLEHRIRERGYDRGMYLVVVILTAVIFSIAMAVFARFLPSSHRDNTPPQTETEQILTFKELGIEEGEPWIEEGSSILGRMVEYWNYQEFPDREGGSSLEFDRYESKSFWLLSKIKEDFLASGAHTYDDGSRIYRETVPVEGASPEGVHISRLKETAKEADGTVLYENFYGYFLEKPGVLVYIRFEGITAFSEEKILKLAVRKLECGKKRNSELKK